MSRLEELRELGLPMISRYARNTVRRDDRIVTTQQFVSYTIDREKADGARALGATVTPYVTTQGLGYDISCTVTLGEEQEEE